MKKILRTTNVLENGVSKKITNVDIDDMNNNFVLYLYILYKEMLCIML